MNNSTGTRTGTRSYHGAVGLGRGKARTRAHGSVIQHLCHCCPEWSRSLILHEARAGGWLFLRLTGETAPASASSLASVSHQAMWVELSYERDSNPPSLCTGRGPCIRRRGLVFRWKGSRQHRGQEGMGKQEDGQKGSRWKWEWDQVRAGLDDSVLKTLYFLTSHTPRAFSPPPLRLRQLSLEFSLLLCTPKLSITDKLRTHPSWHPKSLLGFTDHLTWIWRHGLSDIRCPLQLIRWTSWGHGPCLGCW